MSTNRSDTLSDTLSARAARAGTAPDPEDFLRGVGERRRQHAKRRRVALAAAGSSVAVVAIAASVLAFGTDGSSGGGGGQRSPAVQAGGPASASPTPERTTTPPVNRPAGTLVAAPPTPGNSDTSLGLVPKGYGLVGVVGGSTTYRTRKQDPEPSVFTGKVAVLVGERYDKKTPPGRIAGYPGAISTFGSGDTQWVVRVYYSRTIEIDVQIPRAANLDRAQARRMANTLEVHSVSSPGHG